MKIADELGLAIGWLEKVILFLLLAIVVMIIVFLSDAIEETWPNNVDQEYSTVTTNFLER